MNIIISVMAERKERKEPTSVRVNDFQGRWYPLVRLNRISQKMMESQILLALIGIQPMFSCMGNSATVRLLVGQLVMLKTNATTHIPLF